MLKFQLASDIHTEFYASNQGRKVLQKLAKDVSDQVDGIIIPGDLSDSQYINYAISVLCDLYENVIYTPGNHEYYKSSKFLTEKTLENCAAKYSNFHYLNRSFVEINNQRFIGTTLWYPATETAIKYKFNWSDFKSISDSYDWILNEFEINKEFLASNIKSSDVVLTHFLPCKEAIHSKWVGEKSNCYFLGDVSDVITEKQPKLWVFGHTHNSMKFSINKTDFYCNPMGYPNYGTEGTEFNKSLILEV